MSAHPRISESLYQVTHVTLDELRLHFETEVAVSLEDGSLAVRSAPTPVAERKALRELICAARAA
ncbi:type III secretion system co-regulatory protein PtrC [Pseudomonas sp. LFM046]|uniref:type III secretion system co-regulatory protein PtrC n=1 Tax=Pseudomonas sp. LFM046 TaxID=1608357 RepID=UPI0005CF9719|nr:type III secretion system co-regulatory protein PtrC [Pseudomonas sp. LFM046]